MIKLRLERDIYRGQTTLGKLYDHLGNFLCYTLEDTVRGFGIKDKTNTAIPCTFNEPYKVSVMPSGKYGEAVTIYTHLENGVPILREGDIEFKYIRCHAGNKHEHSEGCLLVNKNRDEKTMTAWGSYQKELLQFVKNCKEDVFLEVINLPQKA